MFWAIPMYVIAGSLAGGKIASMVGVPKVMLGTTALAVATSKSYRRGEGILSPHIELNPTAFPVEETTQKVPVDQLVLGSLLGQELKLPTDELPVLPAGTAVTPALLRVLSMFPQLTEVEIEQRYALDLTDLAQLGKLKLPAGPWRMTGGEVVELRAALLPICRLTRSIPQESWATEIERLQLLGPVEQFFAHFNPSRL